jgi:hypothetical protein
MKRQEQSANTNSLSRTQVEKMRRQYENMQQQLIGLPWILQGTVVERPPYSPTARSTYMWTRKVRAKTVSVALSPKQAIAFRQAIEANRRVEDALTQMREMSQAVLFNSLPKAKNRSLPRTKTQQGKSS